MADPPPHSPEGGHGRHAGDFYLIGDVEPTEKVRPVAEGIHFGLWRRSGWAG